MYRIDDIGSTFISLPPNLQNVDNECFGYAFDRQIARLNCIADKLSLWADLDNADAKHYDYMAMTIGAPYYESEYSDDQKLRLLKSALATRRYAGTVKAIEELLTNVFDEGKFIPWYEYDGEPYHFKISVQKMPSAQDKALFTKMLKKVKATRSVIDEVDIIEGDFHAKWYIGMAMEIIREEIIQSGEGGI